MQEMIISRAEFEDACHYVDEISGTMAICHTTEEKAARLFPNDDYIQYLEWLRNYIKNDEFYYELNDAKRRFEAYVNEIVDMLDPDGSLYVQEYRAVLVNEQQILYALNRHFGMAWIFDVHVREAVKRRRQRWHE